MAPPCPLGTQKRTMAETIHILRDMRRPTHPSMARLRLNLLMVPDEGGTLRNFHHKGMSSQSNALFLVTDIRVVSTDISMVTTALPPVLKHTITRIKCTRHRILQLARQLNTKQARTAVDIELHPVGSAGARSVSLAEATEAVPKVPNGVPTLTMRLDEASTRQQRKAILPMPRRARHPASTLILAKTLRRVRERMPTTLPDLLKTPRAIMPTSQAKKRRNKCSLLPGQPLVHNLNLQTSSALA